MRIISLLGFTTFCTRAVLSPTTKDTPIYETVVDTGQTLKKLFDGYQDLKTALDGG